MRGPDGRFGVLLRDAKSSSLLPISNWAGKTMRCCSPPSPRERHASCEWARKAQSRLARGGAEARGEGLYWCGHQDAAAPTGVVRFTLLGTCSL